MIKKLRYLFTLMLLLVASVGWAEDVTDVLTASSFAATGTTYTDFSGVSATSDAKYAGNSAKSSDGAIQMRSKNSNSGIVSTTSGGKVKSVTITVGSGTNTIDVYGSNNAYTAASDLYDSSKQGTKVGSLNTTGTITFEDDYEYIGIRSNNGAIYLTKVEIVWTKGAVATPKFTPDAGTYTTAKDVTIACETAGSTIYYTTDGTDPTKASTQYTDPINVSTTTTLKAIAYVGTDASSVANATYTIVNIEHAGTEADPYTVADARAAIDANTGVTGVYVTGIVSKIVTEFNAQYGNISFNISSDGTEEAEQLEAFRCFKGADKEKFTSADDVIVADKVVLYGNLTKYGNTYELAEGNYVVSLERTNTKPIINAEGVTLEYNAISGELSYTITNPVEGKALTATTTANWISNITVTADKVTFTTTENDGTEDRTATITLKYDGAEDVTVTITQKCFVADFAALPFEFNGGKADVENTAGLTENGLGSDYSSAPKLKFDGTGDYLVLKFNERPGKLTFDIKGNSFSGGTFKVQTSEDGETYTDLETYTTLSTQNEEFNNLPSTVRYIKWVYTTKSTGNVALGNIKLEKYATPQNFTLTVPATDNVTITAAYGTDGVIAEGENAEIEQGAEVVLTVDVAEGYVLKSLAVTGPDGQSFSPAAVADTEGAYKFTMPAYNATVVVTVEEYVEPVTAKYVLATSITSGKHYVIASGAEGSVKVMGEQNNNNRGAVDATITDGKLSVSDEYEFVIESATVGEATGYSIFDAAENGYLYAAGSSSNYLRTQEENDKNGIWTISIAADGEASVVAEGSSNRNVMQYNSGNTIFSCYASASQSPVYLFEKVEAEEPVAVTITSAGYATYVAPVDVTFAGSNVKAYAVKVGETSVKFNEVTEVPAGAAVVVEGAEGTHELAKATGEVSALDNDLQAATSVITVETQYTYYVLNVVNDVVGFYPLKVGKTIKVGQGYFEKEAGAKFYGIDDDATGINDINVNDNVNANDAIYSISGQRLQKLQRGINIVNGKKIVVK